MEVASQEIIRLLRTYRSASGFKGIEVGAGDGSLSSVLLWSFPHLHLTLVDAWDVFSRDGDYFQSGDRCSRLTGEQHLGRYQRARERLQFASDRCELHRALSVEAAGRSQPCSIDFVIIDADHTLNAMASDLEAWWPVVRPGGLLLGKDYGHRRDREGIWGISRAVHEFALRNSLQVHCEGAAVWRIEKPHENGQAATELRRTDVPNPAGRGRRENDLAVCTAFFNPARSQRLRNNYECFRDSLGLPSADLWTVEVAFGDAPFELPETGQTLRLRSDSVLWQKEAALNVLFRLLPIRYDKVAWVDADLLFDRADWYIEISRLLESVPVAQCFSDAVLLDEDGEETFPARSSLARAVREQHPYWKHFGWSHPGFAWAARRDWLMPHGLFEGHVTGGGDSLMALAWLGAWNHHHLQRVHDPMIQELRRWREGFSGGAKIIPGFCSGRIRHLWHGTEDDRRYRERLDYLVEAGFDPRHDCRRNPDGLLEWSAGKASLHSRVRDYFEMRFDDGRPKVD